MSAKDSTPPNREKPEGEQPDEKHPVAARQSCICETLVAAMVNYLHPALLRLSAMISEFTVDDVRYWVEKQRSNCFDQCGAGDRLPFYQLEWERHRFLHRHEQSGVD